MIEAVGVLRFAEVRRVEKLLKADDLRAPSRGFADALDCSLDVGRDVGGHCLLDQSDGDWCVHHLAKADTFILSQEVGCDPPLTRLLTDAHDRKRHKPEAAQREMVTTSGGTPLPTGVDRRGTRRSKRTHSVFRAIKAQHSGEQRE